MTTWNIPTVRLTQHDCPTVPTHIQCCWWHLLYQHTLGIQSQSSWVQGSTPYWTETYSTQRCGSKWCGDPPRTSGFWGWEEDACRLNTTLAKPMLNYLMHHILNHPRQRLLLTQQLRVHPKGTRTWQQPHVANTVPVAHACGLMGLMVVAPQRLHVNLICKEPRHTAAHHSQDTHASTNAATGTTHTALHSTPAFVAPKKSVWLLTVVLP
jgi:hypothetical protein